VGFVFFSCNPYVPSCYVEIFVLPEKQEAGVLARVNELAEDAVQETFLKAYRAMGDFREESSEHTWLTRIAVNTCKDMRRSAWYRYVDRRVSLDSLPEPAQPASQESIELTMCIMALPRKEMEAVMLYYYQGMTLEEIAFALGITAPAVSARLKKGRERLKTMLKGGEIVEASL